MARQYRDPIHHFINVGSSEQELINTPQFQRLRHIHQLALTYMVYPGATHRRFEHSLGVMDLAAKIFDVITSRESLRESGSVQDLIPDLLAGHASLATDRATLVAAAVLHDVGHMPFSHAAEELLGAGRSHESITAQMILSGQVKDAIRKPKPYLRPEDVARTAVKPTDLPGDMAKEPISAWQGVLREIIQSNIVGADRMDYLLRDAYHTGVAYGAFDVHRLVSGIRLLAYSPDGTDGDKEDTAPQLGITEGALHVAEQLQIARYLMFSQVYLHRTRVAYDLHLKEFLSRWLENGSYPVDTDRYLAIDDNVVHTWIAQACLDESHPAHESARRLRERDHFKLVYSVSEVEEREFAERVSLEEDFDDTTDTRFLAGKALAKELSERYGRHAVRQEGYGRPVRNSMPVLRQDGTVEPVENLSLIFSNTPSPRYDYVFVNPQYRDDAREWLSKNVRRVLRKDER